MINMIKRFAPAITAALLVLAAAVLLAAAGASASPNVGAATVSVTCYGYPHEPQMFADFSCTKLRPEFDTEAEIAEAERAAGGEYAQYFARARAVLHGDVRYDESRHFSTREGSPNAIVAAGDVRAYSTATLKWSMGATDLQVTGIYGLANEAFTVFVSADEGAPMPSLVLGQYRGSYSSWRANVPLKQGMNTFSFYPFTANYSEVSGGAVYLVYNGTAGADADVYIEGGGYYPVLNRGTDTTELKGRLAEYEPLVESGLAPDMGEIEVDHALITTTASSMYAAYVENEIIDPQLNVELWSEYFTGTLEFNGIATDPSDSEYAARYDPRNDYVRFNLRYMSVYSGSNAYAYTDHIGYYHQMNWFANFNDPINPVGGESVTSDRLMFDLGHELGHVIDTAGRTYAETTNNVNGAYSYLKLLGNAATIWMPYSRTLESLISDRTVDHTAYREGRILYTGGTHDGYVDHNYLVWWYLESVFPGYWGRLNNCYRYPSSDYNVRYMNVTERMVYYSCLVTEVDLRSYFERWGVYMYSSRDESPFAVSSASAYFKAAYSAAVESGDIDESAFTHFWYVNDNVYDFSVAHAGTTEREYKGEATVSDVIADGSAYRVVVGGSRDPDHLGYEIQVSENGEDWSIAGFTYSGTYTDAGGYAGKPYYRVVPINMYFHAGEPSAAVRAGESVGAAGGPASVDGKYYGNLEAAIAAALADENAVKTVVLHGDVSMGQRDIPRPINFVVGEEVDRDITVTHSDGMYMFRPMYGAVRFVGRSDARIVFGGNGVQHTYATIYVGGGDAYFENVVFDRCTASMDAGAVTVIAGSAEMKNCEFVGCVGKRAGAIAASTWQGAKVVGCRFTGNSFGSATDGKAADIYVGSNSHLTINDCVFERGKVNVFTQNNDLGVGFEDGVSALTLGFDKFEDTRTMAAEGFFPTEDQLAALSFADVGYTAFVTDYGDIGVGKLRVILRFESGETVAEREVNGRYYTLGGDLAEFGEDKYITAFVDRETNRRYAPGERVYLTGSMTFSVELAAKSSAEFVRRDGRERVLFVPDERMYLPCIVSGESVCGWKKGSEFLTAGKSVIAADGDVFMAVYPGLLCYTIRDADGEIVHMGYGKYGDTISLAGYAGDITAWLAGGETLSPDAEFTLTSECDIVGVREKVYDLNAAEIEADGAVYDGGEQCPAVTVTIGGESVPKECYTVSYDNNIDAGQATVTVTAAAQATGQKSAFFTIARRVLTEGDVTIDGLSDVVFDGSETSQTLAVSWKNTALQEGRDVEIAYEGDRTQVGEVTVVLTFIGNFDGCVRLTYNILPPPVEPEPDPQPEPEPEPEPQPEPQPEPEPEDPDSGKSDTEDPELQKPEGGAAVLIVSAAVTAAVAGAAALVWFLLRRRRRGE